MGWAQEESGTADVVVDTELDIGTNPLLTDATYQLYVDLNEMVAGDVLLVRFYEKVTGTGETQRSALLGTLVGVQANELFISIPVLNIHGGKFTLEQTDGSARDYKWSIRAITS